MKVRIKHAEALRVCFVTEDFYPSYIGGQGVYGRELVMGLAGAGTSVTVLAENRVGRRSFWKGVAGIRVCLVPFCFGNQLVLAFLEYVFFIVRLGTHQFDILHANQLTALFFLLFRPGNIKRIVVSVHNTWRDMARYAPPLKRLLYIPLIALESFIFQRADGLLFHTKACQEQVLKECPGVMYSVVPLGVSPVHVSAQQIRQSRRMIRHELGLPPEAVLALTVSRLVRRKHIETILHALRRLHEQGKPFFGVIIGRGSDALRLQRMAPPNALLLGFIPDTKEYFLASDLFVLPSVAEGGVALSVLEAASFGLPLLVSRDASDESILVDGKNGYIIDPLDPEALASSIERVARAGKALGFESKRKAGRLTWPQCASGTIRFYRSLLETAGDTP